MHKSIIHEEARKALVLLVCITVSDIVSGAGSEQPVSADWQCKWCEFESGTDIDFDVGFGNVSDDSFKFGQYTGLGNAGTFGLFSVQGQYRSEDGDYWNMSGDIIGSDRISLNASGGRQGLYDLLVAFDQLPVLYKDTAQTPYYGSDDSLQLAPGWVRADSTGGMTALQNNLHPVTVELERRRLTIGAEYLPARNWDIGVKYRRDEKSGRKTTGAPIGGSLIAGFPFLTRSALLYDDIAYVTHVVDVDASYAAKDSYAALGYSGSYFEQHSNVLIWENAFLAPGASTADLGRIGAEPTNSSHQVHGTLQYRFSPSTRATARLAAGRMEQDENFLPFTINSTLQSPLPRTALEGEIDTLNGQFRISSSPIRKLSLNANYSYDDRDNGISRDEYSYIRTDAAFATNPRTNLSYSFTKTILDLNAAYRLGSNTRLWLGYDRTEIDRNLQEIEGSSEDVFRGALNWTPHVSFDVALKYLSSTRDGDEYQPVSEIMPAENPLMRKFNMADRDRKVFTSQFSYAPNSVVGFGLNFDYGEDEYSESIIGLTSSTDVVYTADVSVNPRPSLQVYAFASHQDIESKQFGSQSFDLPTWSADTKDSFGSAGLNLNYGRDLAKLSFSLEFLYSEALGMINLVSNAASTLPYPDLESTLKSADLFVNYTVTDKLSLRFGWLYESYDSSDWALDNVRPDTIPTVITLGDLSHSYSIHVPSISFRYQY